MKTKNFTKLLFMMCLFASIMLTGIETWGQTITIQGNAYKMGQTDHSNIKVILHRTVPSAYDDTITTDATGHYSKTVYSGIYNIKFYNDSFPFPTDYQYQRSCYSNQTLNNVQMAPVNGTVPAGNYYPGVTAIINSSDTTNIQAGAKFYFLDGAGINNSGVILALGSISDSITFTKYSNSNCGNIIWSIGNSKYSNFNYIFFNGPLITWVKSAVCNFTITNSKFMGSSSITNAINTWMNGQNIFVYNCYFSNEVDYQVAGTGGIAKFKNCIFNNGILSSAHGTGSFYNCIFYNKGVLTGSTNNPIFKFYNCIFTNINNKIIFNSYTSKTVSVRNSVFINNINSTVIDGNWDVQSSCFYNNGINSTGSYPNFGNFVGINNNGDSIDVYGNIFVDPMLVDTANGNYHLLPGSPCIDAGDNLSVTDTTDFDGNIRVADGNGDGQYIVDMGPYEFNSYVAPPTTQSTSLCGPGSVTLTASGATGTETYNWYDVPIGGTVLGTGSNFTTPVLTQTDTFYVAIDSSGYESVRVPAIVTVNPLPHDIGQSSGSLPASLNNGLVAYYPFNGNANDESGNGNNGIVNGATLTTDRFGNLNKAYSFDGISNSVTTSYIPPNVYSVSLWFYADQSQTINSGLISTYNGGSFYGNYASFNVLSGQFCLFYLHDGNTVDTIHFSNWNEWCHMVITSSGSNILIYLNGVLVKSIAGTTTHAGPIYFGDSRYNSRYFKGKLDDARIYNRVLTPQEIQELYQTTNNLTVQITNDTICNANSALLQILNSQPGVSYQLLANSNNYGSPQVGNTDTLNFNITGLTGLVPFTIYATDTATGCNLLLDTVLNVFFAPAVSVDLGNDRTICSGQSVLLDAGLHQHYYWNTGASTRWITVQPTVTTIYYVTVTDNGCTATDNIQVKVSTANCISVTTSSTPTNCNDSNGTATATPTGGTSPYHYQWTSGDTTQTAVNLAAGIYGVTVTDVAGNHTYGFATVGSSSGPVLNATVTNVSCYGGNNGSISLSVSGGTSPYTFLWSNGATTQNISNLFAGSYDVQVKDASQCISMLSVTVNQPNAIVVNVTTTPATCGGNDGTANVAVSGGTSPYTINWSTGSHNNTITGLAAGSYSVTVSDTHNCTCHANVNVVVSNTNAPVITLDTIIHATCNSNTGSILVSVSGGSTPYTYLWTGGSTNEDLINVEPGVYDLQVMDDSGCIGMYSGKIESILPQVQPICMVSVDSATGTNKVIWEKVAASGIDYYKIYRETSIPNQYMLIDTVHYASMSEYTDPVANPFVRSWRYKISAVDVCGNESPLSDLHKTIHLTINHGLGSSYNLIWDDYEGFPYYTFYINRHTNALGWQVLDSLPNTLHSYTDTPPSQGGLRYAITIISPNACVPTSQDKANGGPYSHSYSNMEEIQMVLELPEVNGSSTVTVFPNPATTEINISFPMEIKGSYTAYIYNITGQCVMQYAGLTATENKISLDKLTWGVYTIELRGEKVYRGKLVVQ